MIYVLIIMIPLMIIAFALADLTLTNLKINRNVVNHNQAYYNAEAGLQYGLNRIESLSGGAVGTFYLDLSSENVVYKAAYSNTFKDNYAKIQVTYNLDKYNIESTGYYFGSTYVLKKISLSTPVFNLRRKSMINKLDIASGYIDFFVYPGGSKDGKKLLDEEDRFLLSDKNKDVILNDDDGDINFGKSNQNSGSGGIKMTESSFFAFDSDDYALPHITAPGTVNWQNQNGIYYYISQGNLTIGDDGGVLKYRASSDLKILMVEGNLTLDNISTNTAANYFDNLIIYCSGSVILKGCQITHTYDNKGRANEAHVGGCFLSTTKTNSNGNDNSDLDICIMTDTIKVIGDNVCFSYKDGNLSFSDRYSDIKNILVDKTGSIMNWK